MIVIQLALLTVIKPIQQSFKVSIVLVLSTMYGDCQADRSGICKTKDTVNDPSEDFSHRAGILKNIPSDAQDLDDTLVAPEFYST